MNIANNILKHSLQNVYFLVGTACGGKTTMAREISKKHGFIHFNDNWTEDIFKVWQTLVVALSAGLAVWGVINLLEGYGSDNAGANGQYR